jgi:hypothetical protein
VQTRGTVEILDQIDIELEHLEDTEDSFLFWD